MKNKDLKIVFTKSKLRFPVFSWAIMWWTKKTYSHVARHLTIRDWGVGYYHASEGKVNYEHESVFDKKHEIVKEYTLSIPEDLEIEIRKECWQDCGKKYGTKQNIGIFLVDLGLLKTNPWKEGRNCSELIYLRVFKNLIKGLRYKPDTIKPHHIEDIIHNNFIKLDGVWHLNKPSDDNINKQLLELE